MLVELDVGDALVVFGAADDEVAAADGIDSTLPAIGQAAPATTVELGLGLEDGVGFFVVGEAEAETTGSSAVADADSLPWIPAPTKPTTRAPAPTAKPILLALDELNRAQDARRNTRL